ncbi:unnamed protein product [Sympodiomycopsis kandeliae]
MWTPHSSLITGEKEQSLPAVPLDSKVSFSTELVPHANLSLLQSIFNQKHATRFGKFDIMEAEQPSREALPVVYNIERQFLTPSTRQVRGAVVQVYTISAPSSARMTIDEEKTRLIHQKIAKIEATFKEQGEAALAALRKRADAVLDTQAAQLRELREWQHQVKAIGSLLYPEKARLVAAALQVLDHSREQQQEPVSTCADRTCPTEGESQQGWSEDGRLMDKIISRDGPWQQHLRQQTDAHPIHPQRLKAVIDMGPDGPISTDLLDLLRRRFSNICGASWNSVAVDGCRARSP